MARSIPSPTFRFINPQKCSFLTRNRNNAKRPADRKEDYMLATRSAAARPFLENCRVSDFISQRPVSKVRILPLRHVKPAFSPEQNAKYAPISDISFTRQLNQENDDIDGNDEGCRDRDVQRASGRIA